MADPAPRDDRIEQIRRAAIGVFSANGFKGTSMAAIAEAVGISRPAIYQYFENREDVFRSAMQLTLDETAEAAVAALDTANDTADALAGWLRRSHLDGYAAFAGTPFGAELLEAHHAFSMDVAAEAAKRRQRALEAYLRALPGVPDEAVGAALELLLLAPAGLKGDRPTPTRYGQRLDQLARAVAGMLDG